MLRLKMRAFKDSKIIYSHNKQCLASEDIIDRILVMRKQETNYRSRNYLENNSIAETDPEGLISTKESKDISKGYGESSYRRVDEFCREQIVEWSFRVVDYFHIDREVVAIATSYLDRFLGICNCDKKSFKLAATAALHLAIKLNDSYKKDMVNVLSDLSRGEFKLQDIIQMEKFMIETLSWFLHPPTPSSFVGHIIKLMPESTPPSYILKISALAAFFTELSLCDYYFTTQLPSVIAMAAVQNAIEILSLTEFSFDLEGKFLQRIAIIFNVDYDSQEVVDGRRRLWSVYGRSEESAIHGERDLASNHVLPTKELIKFKPNPRKHRSPVCISRK